LENTHGIVHPYLVSWCSGVQAAGQSVVVRRRFLPGAVSVPPALRPSPDTVAASDVTASSCAGQRPRCLRRVLRRRRAQRPDESVVQGVPGKKSDVYDCLDDVARRMYDVSVPPALRPSLDHRQCRLRTPGGAPVRRRHHSSTLTSHDRQTFNVSWCQDQNVASRPMASAWPRNQNFCPRLDLEILASASALNLWHLLSFFLASFFLFSFLLCWEKLPSAPRPPPSGLNRETEAFALSGLEPKFWPPYQGHSFGLGDKTWASSSVPVTLALASALTL